jgi:hypothetical protein
LEATKEKKMWQPEKRKKKVTEAYDFNDALDVGGRYSSRPITHMPNPHPT